MSGRIRVLCVDDNVRLSAALEKLLRLQPDMEPVGCIDRADDLPGAAQALRPDIVLLDLTMSGADPLEVLRVFAPAAPQVRTIILSGHRDGARVDAALDAGAWGYVVKGGETAEIIEAIRRVHAGEVIVPRDRSLG